jgi:acetolactate synthase I/II/III large subunit
VRAGISYRPSAWQKLRSANERVHPVDVCRAVDDFVTHNPDTILVCDGGEFAQWPQALVRARRRMINGVAGSIGASLPFAIAAKAAAMRDPVIAMMGDGTFGYHMAELDTAVRYALPVMVIIGNDARWNAEYQIQVCRYGQDRARGCELLPTRYEQIAAALGGYGACVTRADQLPPTLLEAFSSGKPACINIMIESVPAPNIGGL